MHQGKARIAAPTAGVVVWGTGSARGALPGDAGRWQLTGAVLIAACAAMELLREGAQLVVLRAVEQGLEVAEPEGPRPAGGQRSGEGSAQDVVTARKAQHLHNT